LHNLRPPRGLTDKGTGSSPANPGIHDLLRKTLDDGDHVVTTESESASLRQQLLGLRPDDASLGLTRNRNATTAAKLENTLVSQDAKRPQHGVAVDAQDRCHVVGGRQTLAGTDIAVCDVATDLRSDLVMQGHAVVAVKLDVTHGDNHSVTIVSGTSTALKEAPDLVGPELVVREARRRQRRRWLVIAVVIVASACVAAAIVGLTGGRVTSRHPSLRPARIHKVPPVGPTTTGVIPQRPGSLAIGPNGNLYIADEVRNQVLERLPTGTVEPVAGNGSVGFSGDGGPATSAQFNYPAGITFGPDGTLNIADEFNGRIRAVSPTGIITTLAGNGVQTGWVTDGTPALDASLSPSAMAFVPDGLMYVTTGQEVLRLDEDRTFTRVLGENANDFAGVYGIGGRAVDASTDDASGLAFDSAGNLYVFGFATKAILMVDTSGVVHFLGSLYPRGPSGLVRAPGGSVVAMDQLGVVGLSPQGIKTLVSFPPTDRVSYLGITGFSPDGIAIGPNSSICLDTFYGNGYTDKSAMNVIPPQGSPSLLWAQKSP
jgi:hypothetical protein